MNMDMLLTLVGLGLVVIGLLVLLFGRSRAAHGDAKSNVFEAFGIKLDVANPSILLIMFGVVMMLTPRFVPVGQQPALHVAEAGSTPSANLEEAVGRQPPPAERSAPAEPIEVAAPDPALPAVSEVPAPAPSKERIGPPPPPVVSTAAPKPVKSPEKPAMQAAGTEPQSEPAQLAMAPPTAVPPLPKPLRMGVYTEAFSYEGETDDSMRSKMQQSLHKLVAGVFGDEVTIDSGNAGFRTAMREGSMEQLCKRTRMDRLLLADLTPVDVVSSTASADWPEMRYAAVDCASGRFSRSDWIRMEPVVGDAFPMQQSMLKTARRFVHEHRYLLEQQ